MEKQRKIIHCDCDCFYASIEMRDNAELRHVALAVGGSPDKRGVVATCNYAARKFGIHSAMAAATAKKRCPDLVIIRPNMEKYRVASAQIHEIFRDYTDKIEPLSLDEAYLDVSHCEQHHGSATLIAEEIRARVAERVGITISAGIAPNKFIAKIASDWNKPNGQFVVTPAEVEAFVLQLPVKKLFGVGKVTAAKMARQGLETCADLRDLGEEELTRRFGSFGTRLYQLSQGIDNREVQTERSRKSLSVENTYAQDLPDLESCLQQFTLLQEELERRLAKHLEKYQIKKQFVKIKFHDFTKTTVEMLSDSTTPENFLALAEQGFLRGNKAVRLLGMGVRLEPINTGNTQRNNEVREQQLAFELQG